MKALVNGNVRKKGVAWSRALGRYSSESTMQRFTSRASKIVTPHPRSLYLKNNYSCIIPAFAGGHTLLSRCINNGRRDCIPTAIAVSTLHSLSISWSDLLNSLTDSSAHFSPFLNGGLNRFFTVFKRLPPGCFYAVLTASSKLFFNHYPTLSLTISLKKRFPLISRYYGKLGAVTPRFHSPFHATSPMTVSTVHSGRTGSPVIFLFYQVDHRNLTVLTVRG